MSAKSRSRQPAGVPVGGEYAQENGASTGLSLASDPDQPVPAAPGRPHLVHGGPLDPFEMLSVEVDGSGEVNVRETLDISAWTGGATELLDRGHRVLVQSFLDQRHPGSFVADTDDDQLKVEVDVRLKQIPTDAEARAACAARRDPLLAARTPGPDGTSALGRDLLAHLDAHVTLPETMPPSIDRTIEEEAAALDEIRAAVRSSAPINPATLIAASPSMNHTPNLRALQVFGYAERDGLLRDAAALERLRLGVFWHERATALRALAKETPTFSQTLATSA